MSYVYKNGNSSDIHIYEDGFPFFRKEFENMFLNPDSGFVTQGGIIGGDKVEYCKFLNYNIYFHMKFLHINVFFDPHPGFVFSFKTGFKCYLTRSIYMKPSKNLGLVRNHCYIIALEIHAGIIYITDILYDTTSKIYCL